MIFDGSVVYLNAFVEISRSVFRLSFRLTFTVITPRAFGAHQM